MTKREIIDALQVIGYLIKGTKVATNEPVLLALRAKMLELINLL